MSQRTIGQNAGIHATTEFRSAALSVPDYEERIAGRIVPIETKPGRKSIATRTIARSRNQASKPWLGPRNGGGLLFSIKVGLFITGAEVAFVISELGIKVAL